MKIISLLLGLDIFAVRTELIFLNKSKTPSLIGLLLSLIFIVLVVLLFYDFSKNMLTHENPAISFTKEFHPVPRKNFIPAKDFKVVFGFLNFTNSGSFFDPSMFKISFNIIKRTLENDRFILKGIHLGVHLCTEVELKYFNSEEKLRYDLNQAESKFLCSNSYGEQKSEEFSENYFTDYEINYNDSIKSTDDTFVLNGDITTNEAEFIDIRLMICNNMTSANITCKSQSEIIKFLESNYFIYGLSSYSLDPRNYLQPFKRIIHLSIIPLALETTRHAKHSIKNIRLTTDDGFLLKTEREEVHFQANDPLLNFRRNFDNTLIEIWVGPDYNEEFYFRNYDKFQDVLARVSSIARILLLFVNILFNKYLMNKYHLNCFNEISKVLPRSENDFFVMNKESETRKTEEKGKQPRKSDKNKIKTKDKGKSSPDPAFRIQASKQCHDLAEFLKKLLQVTEKQKQEKSSLSKKPHPDPQPKFSIQESDSSIFCEQDNSLIRINLFPKSTNPFQQKSDNKT